VRCPWLLLLSDTAACTQLTPKTMPCPTPAAFLRPPRDTELSDPAHNGCMAPDPRPELEPEPESMMPGGPEGLEGQRCSLEMGAGQGLGLGPEPEPEDDLRQTRSQRSTWAHRQDELAREYVDDEGRDGCTSCPPSWHSIKTFMLHVVRAIFPFMYLVELLYRWSRRKVTRKCADQGCGKKQCEVCCEKSCGCCQNPCWKGLPCYWDAGPASGTKVIMVSATLPDVPKGTKGVVYRRRQDDTMFNEEGAVVKKTVPVRWDIKNDSGDNIEKYSTPYEDIRLPKAGGRLGLDSDGRPQGFPRNQWCKRRCVDPDTADNKGAPWARKQKLVTVRRIAECLGWMYYFLLAYFIVCRSADFHAWIQRAKIFHSERFFSWMPEFLDAMIFGTDPWQVNLPNEQAAHPEKDAFVGVALSVTYYPLCAFLLLVVLHAHEETSYPRRKRIERSVETDSILYAGVKIINKLAHNVNTARGKRKEFRERWSGRLVLCGSLLSVVSTEVFTCWIAEIIVGEQGIPFNWITQKWVPWVGSSLLLLGFGCWQCGFRVWKSPFNTATPARKKHKEIRKKLLGQDTKDKTKQIEENVRQARRHIWSRIFASCVGVIGLEFISLWCYAHWNDCTQHDPEDGRYQPLNASETNNNWNQHCRWLATSLTQFPIFVLMGSLVVFGIGALMINIANSNAARRAGRRSTRLKLRKGDRVEIGPGLSDVGSIKVSKSSADDSGGNASPGDNYSVGESYVGEIGTIVALAGQLCSPHSESDPQEGSSGQNYIPQNVTPAVQNEFLRTDSSGKQTFEVPPNHCVVQLHESDRGRLVGYIEMGNNQGKCALVPIENICDVDWATAFNDTFAEITERELRKLSFENEKYGERYSRRFRELQCTPIAKFHLAKFDKSTLDQLIEIYLKAHSKSSLMDSDELRKATNDLVDLCFDEFKLACLEPGEELASQDVLQFKRVTGLTVGSDRAQCTVPTAGNREKIKGRLESHPEEVLAFIQSRSEGARTELRKILHTLDGATGVTEGEFFQHFKGSLIFEKPVLGKCWKRLGCLPELVPIVKSVLKGAVLGLFVGSAAYRESWIVFPLAGGMLGAAIGWLERDLDATAHHLAGHILQLQTKMEEGCTQPSECHETPAIFADDVGKMILFLSKARQLKRRLQWRTKIWYISIVHAALPFLYTFVATMPSTVSWLIALYIATGMAVYFITQSPSRPAKGAKIQVNAPGQSWIVSAFQVLISLAYLAGPVVCFFGATFSHQGSESWEYARQTRTPPDVCSLILDTQGQCCCEHATEVVDNIVVVLEKHPERKDTFQCCPSEFCWDRQGTSYGSQMVKTDGVTCFNQKEDWRGKCIGGVDSDGPALRSVRSELDEPRLCHKCGTVQPSVFDQGSKCAPSLPGLCDKSYAESGHVCYADDCKDLNGCDCISPGPKPGPGPEPEPEPQPQSQPEPEPEPEPQPQPQSEPEPEPEPEPQPQSEPEPEPEPEPQPQPQSKPEPEPEPEPQPQSQPEPEPEPEPKPPPPPSPSLGFRIGQDYKREGQVCFGQEWLDDVIEELDQDDSTFPSWLGTSNHKYTVGAWCEQVGKQRGNATCTYRVAKDNSTACQVKLHHPFDSSHKDILGCLACGGEIGMHLITFWANATFTFAILSRLYACYEDYFQQYHRMLYFLHLTPWSTMKHIYKDSNEQLARFKVCHNLFLVLVVLVVVVVFVGVV
jgi:hypothetical protein